MKGVFQWPWRYINTSYVLKVPKYALNGIEEIKMTIKVNEKSISLKADFGVILHNKEQIQLVGTFTSNDIGIPAISLHGISG